MLLPKYLLNGACFTLVSIATHGPGPVLPAGGPDGRGPAPTSLLQAPWQHGSRHHSLAHCTVPALEARGGRCRGPGLAPEVLASGGGSWGASAHRGITPVFTWPSLSQAPQSSWNGAPPVGPVHKGCFQIRSHPQAPGLWMSRPSGTQSMASTCPGFSAVSMGCVSPVRRPAGQGAVLPAASTFPRGQPPS